MQNFKIYTSDNPMPQPVEKSTPWISAHIAFIKGRVGTGSFYIAAADDEPQFLTVRTA